ncbi:MAG: diguanylate cyclase [Magnetococcales bacterium]|nr:diguanylate cyclase [Magnetococcales bacterium]
MTEPGILLRIGILGAGPGGWGMLKVLHDLPKIQVVGICDLDPEAPGLKGARNVGIPVYDTATALIANQPMDWLINVSNVSLTQRHLLTLEMRDSINIIDGAAAEVVWRFLVGFHQMMELCPEQERNCTYDAVWSFITNITDPVQKVQNQLNTIAFRDPLTGLFTRRILMEFLERELRNSYRFSRPLTILISDADHFKSINDLFGHTHGDHCLQDLAQFLSNSLRPRDLVARFGGEEFVTVLPETGLEDAHQIAERQRAQIEKNLIRPDGKPVTISVGLATLTPDPNQRIAPTVLLEQADQALYQAKNAGRNRVVAFDPKWERVVI